jgi:hypothetical protein
VDSCPCRMFRSIPGHCPLSTGRIHLAKMTKNVYRHYQCVSKLFATITNTWDNQSGKEKRFILLHSSRSFSPWSINWSRCFGPVVRHYFIVAEHGKSLTLWLRSKKEKRKELGSLGSIPGTCTTSSLPSHPPKKSLEQDFTTWTIRGH